MRWGHLLTAGTVCLAACGGRPGVGVEEPWTDVAAPAGLPIVLRAGGTGVDPAVRLHWNLAGVAADSGVTVSYVVGSMGADTVTVALAASDTAVDRRTVTVVEAPLPGNYALRFGGTGRDDQDRLKVRVDHPAHALPGPPVDIGATDFTIEFWLRAEPGDNAAGPATCGANANWINGNVVLDRDRYSQGRKYGVSLADGRLVFGVTAGGSDELTICGVTRVDDGRWHHVAVTRTRATGAMALFVDGRPDASSPRGPLGDISYPDNGKPGDYCGGPCIRSDPFLVLGAEKHDAGPSYPSFRGVLDELRISDTLRYAGTFAPPDARLEPDARTAALYHFDEGAGTLARDVAGREGGPSHGILMPHPTAGPTWVPSSAPTSGRP